MTMSLFVAGIDAVIPTSIKDLVSFRRWARSDEFPDKGHFAFLNGTFWMDPLMENAYSHNQVKGEINAVLTLLAKREEVGRYFPDGMLVSNVKANLSNIPDGMFVSFESFRRDVVRRISASGDDFTELVGTPDMVLEVVSRSSEDKDTEELPELYYRAGISEYWLVDARKSQIRFDILRRGAKGYVAARKQTGGWVKSTVFDQHFRLTRDVDRNGDPKFTLEVR